MTTVVTCDNCYYSCRTHSEVYRPWIFGVRCKKELEVEIWVPETYMQKIVPRMLLFCDNTTMLTDPLFSGFKKCIHIQNR